jgi:heat shock protein beta
MRLRLRSSVAILIVAGLALSLCARVALAEEAGDASASAEGGAGEGGSAGGEEAKPAAPAKDVLGLTEEQRAQASKGAETHQFQAEVGRLMDIIINSLYSNREIFLRELISNASDALDKLRFLALTDKSVLGEGDLASLDIRIDYDKDARTIAVTDKGIGMTKEELIKNLGVVAASGTTKFLDAAKTGSADALSLIGQFGVGFYSVYLVADKVTVVSKSNDSPHQYIWESTAQNVFSVTTDPRGNTLGRGTSVVLHLKEDANEFLDQAALERIATKYSEFINFPIYLHKSEKVAREVPADEEEGKATPPPPPPSSEPSKPKKELDEDTLTDFEKKVLDEEKAAADDEPLEAKKPERQSDEEGVDVTEGDEEDGEAKKKKKDEKPKMKTIHEDVWSWKQINENKAIWMRKPDEIKDEEYNDFYKALTKDESGKRCHIHFSAEGEITFKSILFVPKKAPHDLYDKYYGKSTGLKLYVRRVLIADEFEDFMPRYLNFIRGVVDSDDLPLNVSRETLSKHRILKVMGKKLTRKALEMIAQLASDSEEAETRVEERKKKKEAKGEGEGEDKEAKKEEEEDADEEAEADEAKRNDYNEFFREFGKSIKLGVIEDQSNRSKLMKLLRYHSTKSEDRLISLQTYVDRMKDKQRNIYFITGESIDQLKNSPFLERLRKQDLEVLYMTDALDEFVMNNVNDFEGKKFMSVTKENLKLGDEDEEKARLEALKRKYEKLIEWFKTVYGEKIGKVEVSNRITDSPCVLVTGQYGWSANMQRIMKAQTFADKQRHAYMIGKNTLEINPRHPMIRELKKKVEGNPDDPALKDAANLMLDAAMLASGFAVEEANEFSSRIYRVLSSSMNIDAAKTKQEADKEEEELDLTPPEPAQGSGDKADGDEPPVEAMDVPEGVADVLKNTNMKQEL